MGVIFAYFRNIDGRVRIANGIYEQTLYNYYSSKLENKIDMSNYNFNQNKEYRNEKIVFEGKEIFTVWV